MYTISKRRKEGYGYVTREYSFSGEAHNFMKFKAFVEARKGMRNTPKTCFICGHKFRDDEDIFIAPVLGDKNRIICEHCAKLVEGK